MKNWLYIASSFILLSASFQSCKDNDDELEALEEQLNQKDAIIKRLEEEKNSLNNTNKQLEETNKKLDELLNKIKDGDSSEIKDIDIPDTTFVPNPDAKKFDQPSWTSVAVSGEYAYTMTVVFDLPAEIKSNATANDLMAAFVGGECRCVKKSVDGVFLLTVIGTGKETENVTFRYWNAENHFMYESLITVPFTSDKIFGVVDNPKKFACKQL